jgi:hydroxymethylglutaryl-CoA synthase
MNPHPSDSSKVGIDDLSFYIPSLYLPIEELAEARDLEYAKLNKGLGLTAMSVADAGEDAATMAANAVLDLIVKNDLDPRSIGRIYLGTESALDGSKPMASYVLDMLTAYFEDQYGRDCFLHCDVVDLTFACIGAVDAMQNTIDWVQGNPGRIGIVAGADNAKYELGSGGEYTQGAGATAVLIRSNPRLLAIRDTWGVATRAVHDFFKPVRTVSKVELVEEVLRLAGLEGGDAEAILQKLPATIEVKGTLDSNEADFVLHKETPVFDGPYSNSCYQSRIREALDHFISEGGFPEDQSVTDRWERLIFHLPYAYQARRMFPEIFMQEAQRRGDWEAIVKEVSVEYPRREAFDSETAFDKAFAKFLRAITKTTAYRSFVNEKIEAGERASSLVGNLYTSSIFLSLMSALETGLKEGREMAGSNIGFFAYGSGSKSKIFEGEVQPQWQAVTGRFQLMKTLSRRQALNYDTYEKLHRGMYKEPAGPTEGRFLLKHVETERDNYIGARSYLWKAPVMVRSLGH